jgi:hypothetical protein
MPNYVREENWKIHACTCNECGSFDLENPRDSESDHRDVLRFDCMNPNCKNQPYFHHAHTSSLIEVTDANRDEIIKRLLDQRDERLRKERENK